MQSFKAAEIQHRFVNISALPPAVHLRSGFVLRTPTEVDAMASDDLLISLFNDMDAKQAGAIFEESIRNGKFHGITWPATPSG